MKIFIVILFSIISCWCMSRVECRKDNKLKPEYLQPGKSISITYISESENKVLSLDEESYQRMMKIALQRIGFKCVDRSESPDLCLTFQLSISDSKQFSHQVPMYNTTGGTTTYNGNYFGINNSAYGSAQSSGSYSGTSYQPIRTQYAGSYTTVKTIYQRIIIIYVFDGKSFNEQWVSGEKLGDIPRVLECMIASVGSSGSLPEISPYLLRAFEDNFFKECDSRPLGFTRYKGFKEKWYPIDLLMDKQNGGMK